MEDESRISGFMKWGLGALGLGAVAAIFTVPGYGILIAVAIVVLAVLLFGGYFLWWRLRARRRREQFSAAIEAQTSAAPKSISDPNSRARLDQLRQKFQKGLHEFKSRGKDLYKLPWYVIIGEPGSGKTEALRHSGIEFPPGLQDELQGSGGTVNMDWWFTNRAIILDTAGSMIFNESRAAEAPEWREFLRLLSKARPQCPINGLLLVLSVESLIRDSADTISQKASRLAQQLDLIQRTLDVRFPVYLLVTKCDLLTGFRDFFDGIEDPLLQHQMFGWSNPAPLDDHFRPDMVEQHLQSITQRLRRRRMALLRDTSAGGRLGDTSFFTSSYQLGRAPTVSRRTDEVDALFALPESLMRLAPRLRRYLETIFVAGEWSAKPVFLRGIYFTTSMREGKALDEAIALATGIPLDQLPEDRAYDKSRAFFLRDLFHDKIFRESGLVTRATNTLQLLRKRQLAIFGSASGALLLLLGFAWYGNTTLKQSVGDEAKYWRAATNDWKQGVWWNGSVVRPEGNDPLHYSYTGTNLVEGTALSVIDYHHHLRSAISNKLSGGFIFAPISGLGMGVNSKRVEAQRELFEAGVLRPLVRGTRGRMENLDPSDLGRHKDAWLALLQLETDSVDPASQTAFVSGVKPAEKFIRQLASYVTDDTNAVPNPRLAEVLVATFKPTTRGKDKWPPDSVLGGATLANNSALRVGVEKFHAASIRSQTNIEINLKLLNEVTDRLTTYHQNELAWLAGSSHSCETFTGTLQPLKSQVDSGASAVRSVTNFSGGAFTNLSALYYRLEAAASNASARTLVAPVQLMGATLSNHGKNNRLIGEVESKLNQFASQAGDVVRTNRANRQSSIQALDNASLSTNAVPAYELRSRLYSAACALASAPLDVDETVIGSQWSQFTNFAAMADRFHTNLASYTGPLAKEAAGACDIIVADAVQQLENRFVAKYLEQANKKLDEMANLRQWNFNAVTNCRSWFQRIEADLAEKKRLDSQAQKLAALPGSVAKSKHNALKAIDNWVRDQLGFPVLLSGEPSKPMRVQDLQLLRALLDGLQSELQNPIWQAEQSEGGRGLAGTCSHYRPVVNLLVKDDGTPADWELIFMGSKPGTPEWRITTIFTAVEVSMAGELKLLPDLPKIGPGTEAPLGKGKINSGITLSFKKTFVSGEAQTPIKFPEWGLLRMIRDNKLGRLENGSAWKVLVKLTDRETNTGGEAVLLARPVSLKDPLPKVEDWWN